jgi:hypothetical protein
MSFLLKMTVFWVYFSRNLTDVSEVFTASIIRAIALKRRTVCAGLHGATTQKTFIVKLAAVRS